MGTGRGTATGANHKGGWAYSLRFTRREVLAAWLAGRARYAQPK